MHSHQKHTDELKSHQGDFLSTRKSMFRETLLLGLFVFILMFGFYYVTVGNAYLANKDEIRERLKEYAELSASVIDGDVHATFNSPEQQKSADYQNAIKPLRRILDNHDDIAYIYTMILKDGKVFFVLDPMPEGAKAETGIPAKSNIMDEYKTPTKAMMTAFTEHKAAADLKPYDDPWGHFISGFAPIFDLKSNFVGIVGVDMNARQFEKQLLPKEDVRLRLMSESFMLAFLVAIGIVLLRYASFVACKWLQRSFLQ